MQNEVNHLGQPVSRAVTNLSLRPLPTREPMQGRTVRLESLDPDRHAESLHLANQVDSDGRNWTYLPYGPFEHIDDYRDWMEKTCLSDDPLFFAIVDKQTQRAIGVASYLRIDQRNGVIEVGHLNYSPLLMGTLAATEAMYLMMERAFSLGYRRYEWKCDALNAPSIRAAERLGFFYEGLFRQASIVKGRNRDTAWFSIIDSEWPDLKKAFRLWLEPTNFDERGRQLVSLSSLTKAAAGKND